MDTSQIEVLLSGKEARKSTGGITAKVIAKYEDKKVMIKGGGFKESLMELFSYRLGKTLGIKVNKVEMIGTGDVLGLDKYCSVHWWEDKFKTIEQARAEYRGSYEDKWSNNFIYKLLSQEEIVIMRFFDIIIGNSDRHSSNYGKLNKNIFLIDNAYSHTWMINDIEKGLPRMAEFFDCVENVKVQKFINNFLKITPRKVLFMLKAPKGFQQLEKGKIDLTIKRIEIIQKDLRKRLVEMGKGEIINV